MRRRRQANVESDQHHPQATCPGGGTVDAADLKSASRKGVGVRIPSWARVNKGVEGRFSRVSRQGQEGLGMRLPTAITTGVISLLVAACGSGGASTKVAPVQALNVEVCIEGEARDTKLYVRNLDAFQWRDISISLVKDAETFTRELASLSPESQQAATPFTDSVEFYYPGKIPGPSTRKYEEARKRLHNFGNLESATIVISGPQPGEWTGEVPHCL